MKTSCFGSRSSPDWVPPCRSLSHVLWLGVPLPMVERAGSFSWTQGTDRCILGKVTVQVFCPKAISDIKAPWIAFINILATSASDEVEVWQVHHSFVGQQKHYKGLMNYSAFVGFFTTYSFCCMPGEVENKSFCSWFKISHSFILCPKLEISFNCGLFKQTKNLLTD